MEDEQEGVLEALQVSLQGGNDQSNNNGNQEQEQVQDSERDQEDGDGGGEMQDSCPVERSQEESTESLKGISCQSKRLCRDQL